jgi:hypothetical protein
MQAQIVLIDAAVSRAASPGGLAKQEVRSLRDKE